MNEENRRVLSSHLSAATATVVEIGTWLGLSARFICDAAPNATLYAVDHWNGLPLVEWKGFGLLETEWKKLAPDPWAQFVRDCWAYRERIVPVRTDSWAGIEYLAGRFARADKRIIPDLVYIDGGHGYERVLGDIVRVRRAWPRAVIVGDDWTWPGVKQAVEELFKARDLVGVDRHRVDGNAWWVSPD
jgi:hypothetical protein